MMVELQTIREEKTLSHAEQLICCRFNADGTRLFSGGFDGRLYRWTLADGAVETVEAHRGWIEGMVVSADRQRMYTADSWGQVCAWDTTQEKLAPLWTVPSACKSWLRSIALSADGQFLATCGNEPVVRVFSTADGKLVHELRGHEQPVFSVAFHPQGGHLASGDLHGHVKDWQLSDGQCVRTLEAAQLFKIFEHYQQGGVRAMAFDAAGNVLYCAGFEGKNANQAQGAPMIIPLEWASGQPQPAMTPAETFQGPITDIRVHPEGFIFAVGSSEAGGMLWFWKPGETKSAHAVKFNTSFRKMDLDGTATRIAATAFGDRGGQRGGNGRRLNDKGEYPSFGGFLALYTWQPPAAGTEPAAKPAQ